MSPVYQDTVDSAARGKGRGMTDMRARRFLGILERAVLGAAMSAVLYSVERRLSRRIKDRRDAEHGTT
jgi:hypothetical protein